MTYLLRHLIGVVALALCTNVAALPTTINFESFVDGDILSNEVTGLTFSNAVVLTAGVSLNEVEFPPRSGVNVISDNGGPLEIYFSSPVTSILGYLTYVEPMTLRVYDAALTEVGSMTSLFSSNLALAGDAGSSPNEALSVVFAGGFERAVFTGNASGSSFTLDDLTYQSASNGVPEPSTLVLALLALTMLLPRRLRAWH